MKKSKLFKGSAALILAVILLAGTLPVTAFAEGVEDYSINCPYINIHGLMTSDIHSVEGQADSPVVWPLDGKEIAKTVLSVVPDLGRFALTRDWNELGTAVAQKVNKLLDGVCYSPEGEPANGSGVVFEYPPKGKIKPDSELAFVYDWRADPFVTAEKLNDFIEYVCDASGCEKVCLTAHSCGGVVMLTYFALYGTQRIQGAIFNSTAINGETYTGELMTGQLSVDKDALISYISFSMAESDFRGVVNTVLTTLSSVGALDLLQCLTDDILLHLSDNIANDVLLRMFGYWPTIWAMVPDEYIEAAMNYAFPEMEKRGTDVSALRAKVEKYNTLVRARKTELMNEVNDNCRMGIFARYGYSAVPLTPSWKNATDGIIDVKYASFGATASDFDKTLTEQETAGVPEEYISPDRVINASTCLFPEKTWFVKNRVHAPMDSLTELAYRILYGGENVTVNTFEDYPRFMVYDYKTGSYSPQSAPVTEKITLLNLIEKAGTCAGELLKKIKA